MANLPSDVSQPNPLLATKLYIPTTRRELVPRPRLIQRLDEGLPRLAFLLEHQPPQVHLVIATREDLPLPLSRLRARGQLVEIREPDLRFTEQETAEFLRSTMALELASTDVSALHRRTEGWIAGLHLCPHLLRHWWSP